MSRSFLIRLALAATGMLFLSAAAYLGLGWVMWSDQAWAKRVQYRLSYETRRRLHEGYCRAMVTAFPGDQDGDGVCDGREMFDRSLPRDSGIHPWLDAVWDLDGFAVQLGESGKGSLQAHLSLNGELWLRPGQRRHFRARVTVEGRVSSFPRDFALKLTPPPGFRLAAPGDEPLPAPLVIPVGEDGSIAFDIQPLPEVRNDPRVSDLLQIENARTGEALFEVGGCHLKCGWDGDPLPLKIKIPATSRQAQVYKLSWPVAATANRVIIEAARDEDGAEWHQIESKSPTTTSSQLIQMFPGLDAGASGFRVDYRGSLKFRVVPIRYSPLPPDS